MARKKKPVMHHMFHYGDMALPIPRPEVAKTEVLTRKKRRHPDGFDEAVRKLEAEVTAMVGEQELTSESWISAKSKIGQARIKSAMAVLLTFGVSRYPVPAEEEAAARALATQDDQAQSAA